MQLREDNEKQLRTQLEKQATEINSLKIENTQNQGELKKKIDALNSDLRNKEDNQQELHSLFEREKIIWNSKVTHLEDFRTKLTQDLQESNSKFEHAMTHFNSRTLTEKEKYERTHETYLKQVENSHKETVEELTLKLDKFNVDAKERDRQFEKEKSDLNAQIEKLKNNDQQKLESKFTDKVKENSQLASELKQLKDRGTSEYLKNNFTFEMEKKSLYDKMNELKASVEKERKSTGEKL